MLVGLSAKYCRYFFNVDRLNQWYLSNNVASHHSIYLRLYAQISILENRFNFQDLRSQSFRKKLLKL